MKLSELIEKLDKFDPELHIMLEHERQFTEIEVSHAPAEEGCRELVTLESPTGMCVGKLIDQLKKYSGEIEVPIWSDKDDLADITSVELLQADDNYAAIVAVKYGKCWGGDKEGF